jgi:prepilin-type N-terminal cleavage/methylation domain-containing protein
MEVMAGDFLYRLQISRPAETPAKFAGVTTGYQDQAQSLLLFIIGAPDSSRPSQPLRPTHPALRGDQARLGAQAIKEIHMYRWNQKRRGFTLIELLVVIVIIGILAAIALPNYIKVKEKAKEAEVKANLHNIQLSIERFAVDTEGAYPNYLIGGEAKYAANVSQGGSANAFTNITECTPIEGVSDPLLRKGYIDSYPRNPFVRSGIAIHQVQENLPSSETRDDPLRNGPDGDAMQEGLGTRFGAYCTTMGSVLADPRFVEWVWVDPGTGYTEPEHTWCNIQYDFWDMWIGNKPLPYLPGQFFYKGVGPIVAVGDNDAEAEPILPTEIDQYMLGGYGGIRTKGQDVLGEEQQIVYFQRSRGGGGGGPTPIPPVDGPTPWESDGISSTYQTIWPWTRSMVSSSPDDLGGSPFLPANIGDGNEQLSYGNRNGFRDAIILVLTAGSDNRNDLQ